MHKWCLVYKILICKSHYFQQTTNGISQISFSTDESVTLKKPTSIPEVAKQRELSGTLESESELKAKKQLSDAKSKELSGNDIFGPPPENPPRSLAVARSKGSQEGKDVDHPAPRNLRTSVKVSNVSPEGDMLLMFPFTFSFDKHIQLFQFHAYISFVAFYYWRIDIIIFGQLC